MASLRDVKRRIRSVKNIAQITKAMEVVSMTKMRRTQQFALAARPYALAALDMLKNLFTMTPASKLPPLLKTRKVKLTLLVIVSTDKGLVGGFNEAVFARASRIMQESQKQGLAYKVMTVGKRAYEFVSRKGIEPVKHFIDYGDYVEFNETEDVANALVAGYLYGEWDAVTIVYTHFKTTLRQEAKERNLLPVTRESLEEIIQEIVPEYGRYSELKKQKSERLHFNYTYKFEPRAELILAELAENLVRIGVHHILLESNASEHSARMVTMKNASDNAHELRGNLTLHYNKIRQAGITSEISEIVAGAEALQ